MGDDGRGSERRWFWIWAMLCGCTASEDVPDPKVHTTGGHGAAPITAEPPNESGGNDADPGEPVGGMNSGRSSGGSGRSAAASGGSSASPAASSGGRGGTLAAQGGTTAMMSSNAGSSGDGASGDGGDGSAGMTSDSGSGGSGGDDGNVSTGYPALTADKIGMPMQIGRGYQLAESPVWNPCTKQLMFSDVSAGTGGKGVIHTLGSDGKTSPFITNTGNTNGFAYDIDGSFILTQMIGHIARRSADGMVKVLEASGGPRLHTPDDLAVRSDGTIYFSDGDFCPIGTLLGFDNSLPIYMMKPGSSEIVNIGMIGGPNGMRLSPDEKLLYVAGYGSGTISVFDVAEDGSVKKHATALVSGLDTPDSFCLDVAGNLYIGVNGGLLITNPQGKRIKQIPISGAAGSCTTSGVTNCGFGGDDGKTLYITQWTTLWKIDNMPIPGLDWTIGNQRAKCD